MVRHWGRLGTVIQTVFSFGFFFFEGGCVLADQSPPSSRVDFFSTSSSSVLITTKNDESPGSSRMGVIGAVVIFFHLRPFRINFTLPDLPSSALRH